MRHGSAGISNIDEMILVDRTVDTMTPMCTQLTYEGLLDEVLGIKNGSVSLDKEGVLHDQNPYLTTGQEYIECCNHLQCSLQSTFLAAYLKQRDYQQVARL